MVSAGAFRNYVGSKFDATEYYTEVIRMYKDVPECSQLNTLHDAIIALPNIAKDGRRFANKNTFFR